MPRAKSRGLGTKLGSLEALACGELSRVAEPRRAISAVKYTTNNDKLTKVIFAKVVLFYKNTYIKLQYIGINALYQGKY